MKQPDLTPTSTFDPEKAKRLLAEAEAFTARADPKTAFETIKRDFDKALENLPEKVEVPYHLTPEGERAADFKRVCDECFYHEIDYLRVKNRSTFDRVVNWDGQFPGPCATGVTGAGKTFAAWHALRHLYVKKNRSFKWFPVRLLVTELERYEKHECAHDFFRQIDMFRVLFIDDIDKINWDFESHAQMLFVFMDWVYRTKKPCIVTTNRSRSWWEQKAGAALVRRLFVDGCVEVEFK